MSPSSIVALRRHRGCSIGCLLLYSKMSVLMEEAESRGHFADEAQTHVLEAHNCGTLTTCYLLLFRYFIDIEMKVKGLPPEGTLLQERVKSMWPSTLQHIGHWHTFLKSNLQELILIEPVSLPIGQEYFHGYVCITAGYSLVFWSSGDKSKYVLWLQWKCDESGHFRPFYYYCTHEISKSGNCNLYNSLTFAYFTT